MNLTLMEVACFSLFLNWELFNNKLIIEFSYCIIRFCVGWLGHEFLKI